MTQTANPSMPLGASAPGPPIEPVCVTSLAVPDVRAAMVWSFVEPVAALSSAPVGGGTRCSTG